MNQLVEDREVMKVKWKMAQAFGHMLLEAYDALLHHGVNYRDLKEYKDETLLDHAKTLPVKRQEEVYGLWMERVKNGIVAAVRRKSFKLT